MFRGSHTTLLLVLTIGAIMAFLWHPDADAGQGRRDRDIVSDTITARELTLTDSRGRPRIRLTADSNEPGFQLLDERGEVRAALAGAGNTYALLLFDGEGKTLASVATSRTGTAFMIHDAKGEALRASLGMDSRGNAMVSVRDSKGDATWSETADR